MHARLCRRLPLGFVAAAAALFTAAPAHAGLLAASATNCGPQPLSQPFLQWGDIASYTPVPGGNFESSLAGWDLSSGVSVTSGNETYNVGGATDSQSLSLPAGSSVTSPTMCVGIQNPDLRFFATSTGGALSSLAVNVLYWDGFGVMHSAQIGTVAASGQWQPTAQMPLLINLLPLLPGNETPVAFTFTPQGSGNWQIDDLYVDPWGSH